MCAKTAPKSQTCGMSIGTASGQSIAIMSTHALRRHGTDTASARSAKTRLHLPSKIKIHTATHFL